MRPLKIFKTHRGACNYACRLEMASPNETTDLSRYEVYVWYDGFAVIDEQN